MQSFYQYFLLWLVLCPIEEFFSSLRPGRYSPVSSSRCFPTLVNLPGAGFCVRCEVGSVFTVFHMGGFCSEAVIPLALQQQLCHRSMICGYRVCHMVLFLPCVNTTWLNFHCVTSVTPTDKSPLFTRCHMRAHSCAFHVNYSACHVHTKRSCWHFIWDLLIPQILLKGVDFFKIQV